MTAGSGNGAGEEGPMPTIIDDTVTDPGDDYDEEDDDEDGAADGGPTEDLPG